MLVERFPVGFYTLVCLLDLILGFAAICFQVGAIVQKAPYYEIGCGIWTGIIKRPVTESGIVIIYSFNIPDSVTDLKQ